MDADPEPGPISRGLAGFSSAVHAADSDNSGGLSLFELDRALRDGGVDLADEEVSHLFAFFDHNQDGTISVNEFLVGLRVRPRTGCAPHTALWPHLPCSPAIVQGKMNAPRKQVIRRAFQQLDRTGRGCIPFSDLGTAFNAARHPDVVAGIKSEDMVGASAARRDVRGIRSPFPAGSPRVPGHVLRAQPGAGGDAGRL